MTWSNNRKILLLVYRKIYNKNQQKYSKLILLFTSAWRNSIQKESGGNASRCSLHYITQTKNKQTKTKTNKKKKITHKYDNSYLKVFIFVHDKRNAVVKILLLSVIVLYICVSVASIVGMVLYSNSLFDITEKYIIIAKYLIKYMIHVWRLH